MWSWPWQLRHDGILGINRRNVRYIGSYNTRDRFPLVDDKLRSRNLAMEYGVNTPPLQQVVREQHEIKGIGARLPVGGSFVIKPSRGAGGKGILVVSETREEGFLRPSGQVISLADVQRHLSNILAGAHSLAGRPDVALIEDCVEPAAMFRDLSVEGVPDIRIVLLQGVPVMAMLRLSTRASGGRANLHQGAIGVGLDLTSGRALYAVQRTSRVTHHPDTGADLQTVRIPDWERLLVLASRCYDMTGLGYLGADLLVDRNQGPLLLELNARPGLAIQIANGVGLRTRLEAVEACDSVPTSAEGRVERAMALFGCDQPPQPEDDPAPVVATTA